MDHVKRIAELEKEIEFLKNQQKQNVRQKIEVMSSEVVDSNPYSRLMALKRMGIVNNYEDIRNKSVVVVGLGGVGSVAAEMLTRCGIGKLLLYDYDTVEIANMNRLFFRPNQAGMTKTDAAKQTLEDINPDVDIRAFTCNITLVQHFDDFLNSIKKGGKTEGSPVDLVLGCVDNFEARITINQACMEAGIPWIESGVAENAVSGHIQYISPGETACFQCAPPLIVATGIDEKTLKREGVCAASLPTTMGITAGLLVQNAIKWLLGFGETSMYLGYNALLDFFPKDTMRPNPECANNWCQKRQMEFATRPKKVEAHSEKPVEDKPVHEDNDLVEDEEEEETPKEVQNAPIGTHRAYVATTQQNHGDVFVKTDDTKDLSDFMAQLKSLNILYPRLRSSTSMYTSQPSTGRESVSAERRRSVSKPPVIKRHRVKIRDLGLCELTTTNPEERKKKKRGIIMPKEEVEESEDEMGFEEFEDGEEETPKKAKQKKSTVPKFGVFKTMGLNSFLMKGIVKKGYKSTTPIQRKTIPLLLEGKDVVAMARTGSGKTASFLVPMFQKLGSHSERVGVRAILLAPTRELALQTLKFVTTIGCYTNLRSCLLVGGDSMLDQFTDLASNPDIKGLRIDIISIVATPGRLLHHMSEAKLSLKMVQYVVFDEADVLFEMGMAEQIMEIIAALPEDRQTALFSATLPSMLIDFARAGLKDPQLVRLDAEQQLSQNMKLAFFVCRNEEKTSALLYILDKMIKEDQQTVVFVSTRHHCEYLHDLLELKDMKSMVIYGSMDMTARKLNLERFRNKQCNLLIVTDVAARGIDIPMLDYVINYDFPSRQKLFIHRAGRVARMGRPGTAFSLASFDELPFMVDLFLFLGLPLLNQVPEGSTYSVGDTYYGRIPQEYLDIHNDGNKELIRMQPHLGDIQRVATSAYKLYMKTRGKPSAESVRRAKELTSSHIHPMILDLYGDKEEAREDFLEGIRNYRSRQTVFELEEKKNASAAEVMIKTRRAHDGIIKQAREAKDTKKSAVRYEGPEVSEDDEEPTLLRLDHSQLLPSSAVKTAGTIEEVIKGKKRKSTTKEEQPVKKSKKSKQAEMKDQDFYMSHEPDNKNQSKEDGYGINAGLNDKSLAMDIIVGDDGKLLKNNQLVSKWDRKRKKFVKVGVNVDVNKRLSKNESGVKIKKGEQGKMYEEWKRKNKRELPIVGEREGVNTSNMDRWKYKHKGGQSGKGEPKDETKNLDQMMKAEKEKAKKKDMQKPFKDRNTKARQTSHHYKPYSQKKRK
ncbi:DEAD (Asp-Glu-Ala-Asp) box polypeptide 54 [Planoprotostelium fungivorum]|uniref:RNA helicase n=1 Tax=Planoprotostelium fungivorum TaxID=1890364 RepID=A0A2P6MXR7_9EUKA|nr:DEAD (Asp-Glu-Ala-Asp) box polypeptide 54 [Planoprotostelium fungivorum]